MVYRPSRRAALKGIGASATGLHLTACATSGIPINNQKSSKPNIVFILADDLGYADLSCYGRREYKTPNIDKLAADGLRFTSGYANSAVCSATRTGLITGRYQYRFPVGLEEPLGFNPAGLEPDVITLPGELKRLGYETALVGKWHMGVLPDYGPLKSGYDHFYGIREGGVDYFSHDIFGENDLWDGEVNIEESGYMTDLLGDRAISQLEAFSASEAPFFMSLHFTAPHWPWEGNNAEGKAEADRLGEMQSPMAILHYDGGSMQTYAEMVTRLDDQVGRVLDALKRLGMEDNTIIVFTSDNGGERFSDNWPFTGAKGELLEGGIRVPMIVKWPGKVEAGSESDAPMITMDWMPTFIAAADESASSSVDFDGVNLMDLLLKGEGPDERALYWRYNMHDQKAIRVGRWKYLQIAGNEFLFDVVADPLERGNQKLRQPEIFADLKARYSAWDSQMLPYTAENFSTGPIGANTADRYGLTKATTFDQDPF